MEEERTRRRSSSGRRRRRIPRPLVFAGGLLAGIMLGLAGIYLWAIGSFTARSTTVGQQVVTIPKGSTVTFEGDSLTYGLQRLTWGFNRLPPINNNAESRSVWAFPETFGDDLGGSVKIVNHGIPGCRASEAIYWWRNAPTTALTVIMFGTNDSNPEQRKGMGTVALEQFRQAYSDLIDRRLQHGGKVLLLLPPDRREHDEILQEYRDVIIQIAAEKKVPTIDTRSILSKFEVWTIDGIHPTDAAYRAIGDYLTGAIVVK